MNIVSSSFAAGQPQADGRRYVTETHVDRVGVAHRIEYGPVGAIDLEAALAAHAAGLDADLRAAQLLAIEAALLAGTNPYPAGKADFDYVSRAYSLGWLLNRHFDDPAETLIHFAPLVDLAEDAEFLALGVPQATIDAVRARIANAKAIKAQIDAYNAAVGAA
jgi:hypothetical protein